MKISMIAIDIAKNIFQVCGVDRAGKPVFNRAIKRAQLTQFIADNPEVTVAMEACSGSNYWGRTFQRMGNKVLLIPPQHVKPFIKGNKNDRNDAFAISEAARRPSMRFVVPRSVIQTDMMLAHKVRQRRVEQRTALVNQLRGLLNEYGIVFTQGRQRLHQHISDLLEDADNDLTSAARMILHDIQTEWRQMDNAIDVLDKQIKQQALSNEDTVRLMGIKGVAEKTATAILAHAGDGRAYKNGRHFSANLGLVPKEHSSGGKQSLSSITKRGNPYIRRLLVQGAWSIMRHAPNSDDRLSKWALDIAERRGKHKATIAVANKLARIIWSMLFHQTEFKAA